VRTPPYDTKQVETGSSKDHEPVIGFPPAVERIEAGEHILEWFDAPGYPAFKSRPQDIAMPDPEFRVSGK
jgi:hypothetical protein